MKAVNAKCLLQKAEEELRWMRVPEALKLFDEAERAECDADVCAAGRWECHMLAGDFGKAWRESDMIAARGNPDPHRFWDESSLEGRHVLIRCLHGLGDTLQYIRYAPLIRERTRFLTIEAQPSLKTLLSFNDLADQVITWGEPEPFWDQQIEVMEIPRIFRTDLGSIPTRVPYLNAPAGMTVGSTGGLLRIGLVWRSSQYNPARSIPVELIARWFDLPGIAFFNLQAGPERFELDALGANVPQLYNEGQSVLATATALTTLDLVITVDTMMSHLAGSLGRKVWTLLPYQCDWRWMLGREDTPWYPTMRLFRQPEPGNWLPVVERVGNELLTYAGRSRQLDQFNKKSGLRA